MPLLPGLAYNPLTGLPKKPAPSLFQTRDFTGLNDAAHFPTSQYGAGTGLNPSTATPGGLFPLGDASLGGLGVPGAAGAPGGSGVAGFTPPDLTGLINNDPLWKQAQADYGADHAANLSALTNQIRQAIIGYGQLPDQGALSGLGLPSETFSALNDETRGLADQNTQAGLSTVARLNQANQQGRSQLLRTLAARGALQSGEAPYQTGLLQTQYNQAQYDAGQKLLGLLGGDYGQYNTGEQSRLQAERQAASDAAGRASSSALMQYLAGLSGGNGGYTGQPGPPPPGPGTPTPPPANPSVNWAPTASDIRYRISSPGGRGGV